jgi:adenosylcobinamide kinase / adenosylcobinamide-phosphate guanylyltransferase
MALSVLLGGARSGKSTLALRYGLAYDGPVCFIATATAGDQEMAERIARHRRERPIAWRTIEEPMALDAALAHAPADALVIVDCLTLWVSNRLQHGVSDTEIEREAENAARRAANHPAPVIAVSNEVGLGIVPDNPLGRAYRDQLGRVNVAWAAVADHVLLLVAGRVLTLEKTDSLGDRLR